jgi:hypothetical protein
MNIDLACAAPQRVQRARSPVSLHRVTMPAARLQQVIERHLSAIMAREDAPNRGSGDPLLSEAHAPPGHNPCAVGRPYSAAAGGRLHG